MRFEKSTSAVRKKAEVRIAVIINKEIAIIR